MMGSVRTEVEADRDLRRWSLHFEKLQHMLVRQGVIYDLCLASGMSRQSTPSSAGGSCWKLTS
jgi:hypothetical protein